MIKIVTKQDTSDNSYPPAGQPTYLTLNTPPWGCALLAEKSRDGRTAYRLEVRVDKFDVTRRYLRLRSESA